MISSTTIFMKWLCWKSCVMYYDFLISLLYKYTHLDFQTACPKTLIDMFWRIYFNSLPYDIIKVVNLACVFRWLVAWSQKNLSRLGSCLGRIEPILVRQLESKPAVNEKINKNDEGCIFYLISLTLIIVNLKPEKMKMVVTFI